MFGFFRTYNTFKSEHAQIAVLFTLIIAIMFLFMVVTLNIGKTTGMQADVRLAASTAAHTVKSYLGSYSFTLWTNNNDHIQQCETNVIQLVFEIVLIIATIIMIIYGGGTFSQALKWLGETIGKGLDWLFGWATDAMAKWLSAASDWLTGALGSIHPWAGEFAKMSAHYIGALGQTIASWEWTPLALSCIGFAGASFNLAMNIVDTHKGMKAANKRMQHLPFKGQVREMGIQQALMGAVDDSTLVIDEADIDEDDHTDDRVSRVDAWYFKRMLNLWMMEENCGKNSALNDLYDSVADLYGHLTGTVSGGTYSLAYFDEDSFANANGFMGTGEYPDVGANEVYLDTDSNDFVQLLYDIKNTWPYDSTIPEEMKNFYVQYIKDWWVSPKIAEKPGPAGVWVEKVDQKNPDQVDLFLLYLRGYLNDPKDGFMELLRNLSETNFQALKSLDDAWIPLLEPAVETIENDLIPLLELRWQDFEAMRDIAGRKLSILDTRYQRIDYAYKALGGFKTPITNECRRGSILYDLCRIRDNFKRYQIQYAAHEADRQNGRYKNITVYSWKAYYKDETGQRIGRWHHTLAQCDTDINLPYIKQSTHGSLFEGEVPEICYTLKDYSGFVDIVTAKFDPGTEGKFVHFAGGVPLWKFKYGQQVSSKYNDFDELDTNGNGVIDEDEVFHVSEHGNIYYVSSLARDLDNKRIHLLLDMGIRSTARGSYSCTPCNPFEELEYP